MYQERHDLVNWTPEEDTMKKEKSYITYTLEYVSDCILARCRSVS